MFGSIRDRLITRCGAWWKLWSVRLAAFASVVVGFVLASPEVIVTVMDLLPPHVREWLPPFASLFMFVGITLIRLWRQPKLTEGNDNAE